MAWRSISDTEVAVDAPLAQQLMQALKDNSAAIAAGDAGAPRIAAKAMTYGSASGDYQMAPPVKWTEAGLTGTFQRVGYWTVVIGGAYRTRISLQETGSGVMFAKVFKNGAAFGTEHSTTGGPVQFEEDLTFAAGDDIEIFAKQTGSASGFGVMSINSSLGAAETTESVFASVRAPKEQDDL